MTRDRAPRAVRATTSIVAFLLLGLLVVVSPVSADTASQLKSAQAKLDSLIKDISSATGQLNALQGELNVLAGQLEQTAADIQQTQGQIVDTQQTIVKVSGEIEQRQSILDQRAALAYQNGPAGSLEFFLGATSLADLQDRIEIVNAAAQSDQDLINGMQERKNQLHITQVHLTALEATLRQKQADLQTQQAALNQKFDEQKSLLAKLAGEKAAAEALVHKLTVQRQREIAAARIAAALATAHHGGSSIGGVLLTCPVRGPHAYSDSFGAPRYAGGFHPHAGNDIMAPMGTPIVAPFPGVATADSNGLGGMAVIVRGSAGYVYNAHLSRMGQLGSVSTGTVVGYVGNSGDAQGGPTHDHFEFHPNVIPANPWRSPYGYTVIGDAIDPYPYLNSVC